MFNKLRKLFQKDQSTGSNLHLPDEEEQRFTLYLKDLKVGELSCEEGIWTFTYSDEFKARSDEFYPIVGFPKLDKVYKSKSLWPFFLIRIPGLGQPRVREIIKAEQLDINNEAQLLRRFGRKTIANPYELTV
jgi:HipA-like protein